MPNWQRVMQEPAVPSSYLVWQKTRLTSSSSGFYRPYDLNGKSQRLIEAQTRWVSISFSFLLSQTLLFVGSNAHSMQSLLVNKGMEKKWKKTLPTVQWPQRSPEKRERERERVPWSSSRRHRLFSRHDCLLKDCWRQRSLNISLKDSSFYPLGSSQSAPALSLTPTRAPTFRPALFPLSFPLAPSRFRLPFQLANWKELKRSRFLLLSFTFPDIPPPRASHVKFIVIDDENFENMRNRPRRRKSNGMASIGLHLSSTQERHNVIRYNVGFQSFVAEALLCSSNCKFFHCTFLFS